MSSCITSCVSLLELPLPRPVIVCDNANDDESEILGEVILDINTTLGDLRTMVSQVSCEICHV